MAHENLNSPTGATLAVRAVDCDRPRALVAIQHGMAEHAARYEDFQTTLAEHGFASVAHDHRGHGATEAPDAALGFFAPENGWRKVLDDARAVIADAGERYPDVPVFLFGHSMGGIVAMNLLLDDPERYAGAAIWNVGFRDGALGLTFRTLLRMERLRKGSDTPSTIARKLTFDAWNRKFAPNRTEFDWLSRDKVEVDKYVVDPLCGFPVTVGMWLDVAEGVRRGADDEPLSLLPKDLPVHCLAGGADPCTEEGKATITLARRLRTAGLEDVTSSVLENTRHEALNEVNRETTTRAFVDWLSQRFD